MAKTPDYSALATLAAGDLWTVVDVDDTAQSPEGSTKKVTTSALATFLGVAAASEIAAGVVELATSAEVITGSDTARAVTPAGAAAAYFPKSGAVQATYNPNIVAATGATETISMNTAVHFLTMDQACVLTISDTAGSDEFKMCVVFLSGAFAITWDTDQDWPDATAPTYATPACFVITSKNGESPVLSASVGQAFG
jgi:hypothetical protein